MASSRPPSLVLLGFDYGECRTGVAVGQSVTGTATPLTTLKTCRGAPDWRAIERLVTQWGPDALVVGLPQTRHGQTFVKRVQLFCQSLQQRFGLPVHTVDESLTSVEAYERLKMQRNARQRRKITKAEIDQLAAAILLESWMDAHKTT